MSDSEEDSSNSENNWPMNEAWMLNILKDDDKSEAKVKINYFSAKSICQHGVSNLSDLIMASIKYEIGDNSNEKQLDIVIKLLPQDPFGRYFVTINQFDLREIQFYTKIYSDLMNFQNAHLKTGCEPIAIAVPKCFYSKYKSGFSDAPDDNASPEPPESILVLQDMRPLGFKTVNLSNGLSLNEAEGAITAIAAVHSLTLGMKLKEKVDLNEKYPFLFQIAKATSSYQQLVEQGFPQLVNFLKGVNGFTNELAALEVIRLKTKSIIEKLLQPIEPMGLITHTDFWCNNLLLKEEKSETDDDSNKSIDCVILDWQMITYSRPTNDLALLILSSLPSKLRRDNTQKLLNHYYTMMKENLNKINIDIEVTLSYTKEKLLDDYKKSQLLALLLCIGSADIALGNQQAEQRFLDVLRDLYKEGVLNIEELSF
ncbi:uncharacterized protein LOC129579220 [Sitodiplosis mosellana]|uniref:uncharacterized protein LOC129579220 n=1 Tax=Sitodiplosis mosellana TaxID=263140 RepID=UPI00244457D0|nr:uncharacterized protein LOC129579220 [Sitodiplosis mosellana]